MTKGIPVVASGVLLYILSSVAQAATPITIPRPMSPQDYKAGQVATPAGKVADENEPEEEAGARRLNKANTKAMQATPANTMNRGNQGAAPMQRNMQQRPALDPGLGP